MMNRHARSVPASYVPQAAHASIAGQRRPQPDANAGSALHPAAPANARDRLVSMDSELIQIDDQKQPKTASLRGVGASQLRDSESEEINIPVQRLNLNDQAFYINLHTFMKENIEHFNNLVIRD